MRERSKRLNKEGELEFEAGLPEPYIDEDGYEVRWVWRVVHMEGIRLVESKQELVDDLITYGVIERCQAGLARIVLAFIRRSYLKHPTSDDVLATRSTAVFDFFVGRIFDEIEEGAMRECNPEAFATQPPRSGEFLVSFLMPREKRDEVVGGMAAYYADMEEEYGTRAARVLYWKEVARSILPILVRSVEWLVKYKVLGALDEHFRHR